MAYLSWKHFKDAPVTHDRLFTSFQGFGYVHENRLFALLNSRLNFPATHWIHGAYKRDSKRAAPERIHCSLLAGSKSFKSGNAGYPSGKFVLVCENARRAEYKWKFLQFCLPALKLHFGDPPRQSPGPTPGGFLVAPELRKLRKFAALCRVMPGVSPLNSIGSIFGQKLAVRRSQVQHMGQVHNRKFDKWCSTVYLIFAYFPPNRCKNIQTDAGGVCSRLDDKCFTNKVLKAKCS